MKLSAPLPALLTQQVKTPNDNTGGLTELKLRKPQSSNQNVMKIRPLWSGCITPCAQSIMSSCTCGPTANRMGAERDVPQVRCDTVLCACSPVPERSINGLGKQFRYEQQFGNGWKGAAKNVKAKTCENRKIGGENNGISQTQFSWNFYYALSGAILILLKWIPTIRAFRACPRNTRKAVDNQHEHKRNCQRVRLKNF